VNLVDELKPYHLPPVHQDRYWLCAEVITLLEWAVEEAEWASGAPLASIRRRR